MFIKRKDDSVAKSAAKAATALGDMRALGAKVGQMLAYIDGVLPEEQQAIFSEQLKPLLEDTPTSSFASIRDQIERELEGKLDEILAKKYRATPQQARAMMQRVVDASKQEGIDVDFDIARSGNTLDAHRLIHFAATKGLADAMKERLMRGYFCEGLLPSDREALVRLGVEVGLEEAEVNEALSGDAYTQDVRADEVAARQLGVTGVPFFVIDGKYGVSGAQPADVLLQVLEQSHREASEALASDAAACGVDGCEVP